VPGESGRFKECVSDFSGGSYDRRYQPWWAQGPSSVKGLPKWCTDARDLVKTRTEDEAPQILGDEMPLLCRLCLGCISIAFNQRLHLGLGVRYQVLRSRGQVLGFERVVFGVHVSGQSVQGFELRC